MTYEIPIPLQQEHEQPHAETEEKVIYPAAILVGEFIRLQLAHAAEPALLA